MRYIIGCHIRDKENPDHVELGYYCHGMLPILVNEESYMKMSEHAQNDLTIYAFFSPDDASKYCQHLSKAYKRDEVGTTSDGKSKKIRKFFVKKADSSTFPFKLSKEYEKAALKFCDKYGILAPPCIHHIELKNKK